MKNILFVLIIIGLGFLSCEGRKTQSQALQESVETFKSKFNVEETKYIPERYAEVKVDTLLTNGFRVKSKSFTDMTKSSIKTTKTNSITRRTLYRHWSTDLTISFENKPIFEEQINTDFLKAIQNSNHSISRDYAYSHVAIDEAKSINDTLLLNLYAKKLETDDYVVYDIRIHKDGVYTLESIERI